MNASIGRKWHHSAAAGAVLAFPLSLTILVELSEDATGLLAAASLLALLIGGVLFEIQAGLAAWRRGVSVGRPVFATAASYFFGASIVLAAGSFMVLRSSALRDVDVSVSITLGALAALWLVGGVTASIIGLVITAVGSGSRKRR